MTIEILNTFARTEAGFGSRAQSHVQQMYEDHQLSFVVSIIIPITFSVILIRTGSLFRGGRRTTPFSQMSLLHYADIFVPPSLSLSLLSPDKFRGPHGTAFETLVRL